MKLLFITCVKNIIVRTSSQVFALVICRGNLPQQFAVAFCRGYLPQLFVVAFCHGNLPQFLPWLFYRGNLPQPFAVVICCRNLPQLFAVRVRLGLFCVCKQIFFLLKTISIKRTLLNSHKP